MPDDEFDNHPTLKEALETKRKFEAALRHGGATMPDDEHPTFEESEANRKYLEDTLKSGEKVVQLKEAPSNKSHDSPRFVEADSSDKWYNEHFAVITDNGRTQVYWVHENGRTSSYINNNDFFSAWAHNKITEVNEDPGGKTTSKLTEAARHWFYKFKDRRTFHFAIFDPNGSAPPNTFNFWPGFGTKPVKGDCHLSLAYFNDILCSGKDEEYKFLFKWVAHMVQKPGEKPETAIVIPGEGEGTGKSFFTKILSGLIDGKDQEPYLFFSTSNAKLVSGDFTGHLRHCLLLHSEEALKPDSEKENSVIKNLISESIFGFHAKFKDAKAGKNFIRIVFTGNQPHIVRASRTSRRYFVPSISTEKMQDHGYFRALQEELDNGGYEALMYELMNTDISDFDVRSAPITEGLLEQRSESHKGPEAFWIDILNTGQLNFDEKSLNRYYPSIGKEYWCNDEVTGASAFSGAPISVNRQVNEYHIIKNRIFVKFNRFEGRTPYRDKSSETSFGTQFCKFFSKTEGFELKKVKIGKYNYYILPPLMVARQCMDDYLGYKYKWDVTITEWGEEPFV
jgi:Family of unknown function (DUF5906)